MNYIEKQPVFIPILRYGLGNKLYQIAAALSLAIDYNGSVKYILPDTDDVNLGEFGEHELKNVKKGLPSKLKDIFPNLNFINKKTPIDKIKEGKNVFVEKKYKNYERINCDGNNLVIDGLFLSYKYFGHNLNEIRKCLEPADTIKEYIFSKYSFLLTNNNCVSIHLRLWNPHDNPWVTAPNIPFEWYKNILKKISTDFSFIVFSDNISKAKSFFKPLQEKFNFIFIENEPLYIDLFLMSYCMVNIIHLSTFSAWAAFLNNNPDKKIFCNKLLFKERFGKTSTAPDWIDPEPISQKIFQPYYQVFQYYKMKELIKRYLSNL